MNRWDDDETRPTYAEWQKVEKYSARLDVMCWYVGAAILGMAFWLGVVLLVRWIAVTH